MRARHESARHPHESRRRGRVWRSGVIATAFSLAAAGAVVGSTAPASADSVGPITFDSYATGSVNGQDGWTSTGSYDQAVTDNSTLPGAPVSFGARSLRISDAVTSGSFGDQTFSKSTVDAAGEPGADTGGYPTGTIRSKFTASFDFASVTPAVEQPGLHLSVSPDRGDGARMSYVRIEDSATGWNLFFDDYQDVAPLGSGGNLDDGCGTGDDFVETQIASNLSRAPHKLEFAMDLVAGPHNDVVKVLLDGAVVATGTSWEDYFRYCAESGGGTGGPLADKSRIVRNVEFRESGAAHPTNAGAGLLIDSFAVATADASLNLTSICTYASGPYAGQHLWRVTSTFVGDRAYTSQSPVSATPVPRTATPGKSWFLGVTNTTKINYTSNAGAQSVVKAANASTCTPLSATITTPPNGATYVQDAVVAADFSCDGNELVSCVGTVADGAPIDTASLGVKTFDVTATSWDGSTANASHSYTVIAAPPDNGCVGAAVPSALISWYPANPGAQSSLKVACKFNDHPGTSQISPSYTIHDMNKAQYHNGAARYVSVGSAPAGATSLTATPSIIGTGMGAWVNRVITGPGIAPRTFVTSIVGDTINLSLPTAAATSESVTIENAPGARSVADASGAPASTTITSATANWTAADVGLSISGTGIPVNTTITAVGVPGPNDVTISTPATLSDPTVTIGAALLTTSTRQVTEATITSATNISSTIAGFGATDVGLSVAGLCDQNTASTGDDYTVPLDVYLTAVADPNATTTGGLAFPQSGCNLTIGIPSANAPADYAAVAEQGAQFDLDPTLVAGAGDCASDQPEGLSVAGTWHNPGSFVGTGLSHLQPGASTTLTTPTKAIGQITFESSSAGFSAFVIERKASTPGDPIGVVHYDLVVPFAPTAIALCPGTATSPGLSWSLSVHATSPEQQTIEPGVGRPGTAQLRSILPSATGGYTATAYVRSDSAVTFSPAASFQRLCIYPVGLPNPASFQCGPG